MGEYSETVAANGSSENGIGSQARHVGVGKTENRGGTKGTVGGVPSAAEEGCIVDWGACYEYAAGFRFLRSSD
jgi:hypothetical protein